MRSPRSPSSCARGAAATSSSRRPRAGTCASATSTPSTSPRTARCTRATWSSRSPRARRSPRGRCARLTSSPPCSTTSAVISRPGSTGSRGSRAESTPLADRRGQGQRNGCERRSQGSRYPQPPMALSNVAGFPRIGPARELKFATEGAWKGEVATDELHATAKQIRLDNWRLMQQAGIDLVPSNDFSLYDHVLDLFALVGAVPERYGHGGGPVDLDTYFAMARGRQEGDVDVTAMEMTKWFDTNYHYIVPELGPQSRFSLSSTKPFDEHAEAMEELGIDTVPVVVGPVSFLLLGKSGEGASEDFDRLGLLEPLLEVYGEVIERLAEQ